MRVLLLRGDVLRRCFTPIEEMFYGFTPFEEMFCEMVLLLPRRCFAEAVRVLYSTGDVCPVSIPDTEMPRVLVTIQPRTILD
jgi:hypothetical protein